MGIMGYFVYILQSERDGSYYVGQTNSLEGQLKRHNEGRSVYTKGKLPWRLVYHEVFESKAEAVKREYDIKDRKDRSYIEQLVRAPR